MRLADLKDLMRRRQKMNSRSKKRLERLARRGGKGRKGKKSMRPGEKGGPFMQGDRPTEMLMNEGRARVLKILRCQ